MVTEAASPSAASHLRTRSWRQVSGKPISANSSGIGGPRDSISSLVRMFKFPIAPPHQRPCYRLVLLFGGCTSLHAKLLQIRACYMGFFRFIFAIVKIRQSSEHLRGAWFQRQRFFEMF